MTSSADLAAIKSSIKTIPDYPKKGIKFRDVTSLVEDATAFSLSVKALAQPYKNSGITKVVGAEARGFIFGAAVANLLGAGFVLARKPNKLPRETISQSYQLEYGTDQLQIHKDALSANDNVLLIDDLIATGGTIEAAVKMVRQLGATVHSAAFVINLPDLGGVDKLRQLNVTPFCLVEFEGE
ncbi:adenine phosphoribosyltransferase [Catenovulum agarivorans DS-2]|uniref:Adenine phosphoribosyltransferase n=1 Tax=Catenovulum agarivorans DS-2 TaxID=1328313 RepID=W7QWN8_9ALTE|nr:adenine phosphoribosyltransferase [Catenovulum agarivorans]EWH09680.1 adenine phosphoribosyltransferase [Catenovulum agarivorans DS-2]